MSGPSLKAETQRPREPLTLPPLVRSIAAIVLFPFDDVLRSMVTAGQGIEALCLLLGLTRSLLDDHLANGWIKEVAGMAQTKHRGLDRVGWMFTFKAAAYNLIRLPQLLPSG